jgi:hypothetical protein
MIISQEDVVKNHYRKIGREGGLKHRSRRQADVVEACKEMRRGDMKSRAAHKILGTQGYRMADGRLIKFEQALTLPTFQRHYWAKAKCDSKW